MNGSTATDRRRGPRTGAVLGRARAYPVHAWTEAAVLDLLQDRYTALRPGTNADRYVRAAHVPTAALPVRGMDRVADYLVLDTYGAGDLHGFEVKVTRSDLLAELRQPAKADAWRAYCDRWWLVVPDPALAAGVLPDGWGLLAPGPGGRLPLRVVRAAPQLDREPMPRSVLAQWARCIATTAQAESFAHASRGADL